MLRSTPRQTVFAQQSVCCVLQHPSQAILPELDVKLAGVSMQMVSDELQAEGHKNEETHHCQQNVSLPCDGSHKIDWSNLTMPRLMKTSEV
ncbi:hypothetical protein PgNI_05412 [Pyricularia grisea]|uniref:Uncharacterized protein n=1 Tax=Pyricularia grisea TaxID=148305 RepID=A0A6P8B5S0_PYRGI|nr:hypothetical protein PgNI_05412 [Pyricularia grisea]TLD10642.1 hypothetical protein PgNI_05412 [Pyricularia grisea]